MANGVEISTNFTIGQAVQKAAQELKTFVATQGDSRHKHHHVCQPPSAASPA